MNFLLQNLTIFIGLIFFACLSWRKTEFGVYGIIFLLPIYLLRLNIFGIPTTVLELGIYTLFFSWLAKNIFNLSLRGAAERSDEAIYVRALRLLRFARNDILMYCASLKKEEKLLFLGILLLMSGAVISTILSTDLRVSAGMLKGWFFDPFLFFVVLVSVIKSSSQAESALKVFSFSGFIVAVISLLYWFGLLSDGVSYDGRLHGFYGSPNYLAMYLAPALIIGVWMFLKDSLLSIKASAAFPFLISPFRVRKGEKKNAVKFNLPEGKEKYFWLISSIIIAAATYFTYSYAAWFAISFAIILLFYSTVGAEKKPSVRWKLGFLIIFLILGVLFFSQAGTDKFKNLENLSYRSSYNSRLMIWRSAFMIGRDNPIFGIGPGNFQKYYLDYQKKITEPYLEWAVPQPHNIYLAFWLQTGILGLTGFVLILVWFFRSPIQNFKLYFKTKIHPNPPFQKEGNIINFPPLQRGIKGDLDVRELNLEVILIAIMVYILLHGIFDTTYWKNDLAIIFWLILGLVIKLK